MSIAAASRSSGRASLALLAAGLLLAAAAPFAAPSNPLLPAPGTHAGQAVGGAVLAAAFLLAARFPLPALYGLVAFALLEGAVRKWLVNDIVVFLLKDFLVLGIYAAVLPTLTRREWRRPPWVLAPLGGLVGLAVVYSLRSDSLSQALVGLRAYALYVPLLWVAPKLLNTRVRLAALLVLLLVAGVAESVLAAVQTLTGAKSLNAVVPGSLPALITIEGQAWIRPTGTMATVGTFSAFLLFPVLVAVGLVIRYRSGVLLFGALAALSVICWGVFYSGSRALAAVVLIAALLTCAHLLWHRRFGSLFALPAMFVLAYVMLTYQPFLGGALRTGEYSHYLRTDKYRYIGPDGKVHELLMTVSRGDPHATGSFIGRATGSPDPGTKAQDLPAGRLRTQLDALRAQGLFGHGTGALALGSQYLLPERTFAAESQYVRVAYELGLPAVVLFVWFLLAVWLSTAWASFVALDWQRAGAIVALGTATLVPLLSVVTYAFDYPIVALLYYTFAGCALAWATRVPVTAATATANSARRAARPVEPTPARS